MGLLSHRVERSELKPGDHIYTWRAAYSYSHHGIYVGGSKVVHFTTKKEAGTAGLDSAVAISSLISAGSPECPTFPDCGFQLPDSGVILTCLDCFLRDGALHGFEYGVPPAVFLAKLRGGTCTTAASDPADAVVHRAMYLLQNGFGSYDVFENNCEDFALYCKTGLLLPPEQGIGRSGQAASAVGVPLAALFSTPFRLMSAGPLGMAAVTTTIEVAHARHRHDPKRPRKISARKRPARPRACAQLVAPPAAAASSGASSTLPLRPSSSPCRVDNTSPPLPPHLQSPMHHRRTRPRRRGRQIRHARARI